jgi:hypothetical protein
MILGRLTLGFFLTLTLLLFGCDRSGMASNDAGIGEDGGEPGEPGDEDWGEDREEDWEEDWDEDWRGEECGDLMWAWEACAEALEPDHPACVMIDEELEQCLDEARPDEQWCLELEEMYFECVDAMGEDFYGCELLLEEAEICWDRPIR